MERESMIQFTVGHASIARIEETYLPVYRPRDIFPEYTDAIAAEAFVTRKTVEANLGRVYRKLGIRSRAQLARALDALSIS